MIKSSDEVYDDEIESKRAVIKTSKKNAFDGFYGLPRREAYLGFG